MKKLLIIILVHFCTLLLSVTFVGITCNESGYEDFVIHENLLISLTCTSIQVQDITDMNNKQVLDEFQINAKYVKIAGDYLLVGRQQYIYVYELDNILNFTPINILHDYNNDAIITEQYIISVKVESINNRTFLSFFPLNDLSDGFSQYSLFCDGMVTVHNNFLYAISKDANQGILKIFDITDPANIDEVYSEIIIPTNFEHYYSLSTNNDRLYVMQNPRDHSVEEYKMTLIDISNPINPELISVSTIEKASDFHVNQMIFYENKIITSAGNVLEENENGEILNTSNLEGLVKDEFNEAGITKILIKNDQLHVNSNTYSYAISSPYVFYNVYNLSENSLPELQVSYGFKNDWNFAGKNNNNIYTFSNSCISNVRIVQGNIERVKDFHFHNIEITDVKYKNSKFYITTTTGIEIYSLTADNELNFERSCDLTGLLNIELWGNSIVVNKLNNDWYHVAIYDQNLEFINEVTIPDHYKTKEILFENEKMVVLSTYQGSSYRSKISVYSLNDLYNIPAPGYILLDDVKSITSDSTFLYLARDPNIIELRAFNDLSAFINTYPFDQINSFHKIELKGNSLIARHRSKLTIQEVNDFEVLDSLTDLNPAFSDFLIHDEYFFEFRYYNLQKFDLETLLPNDNILYSSQNYKLVNFPNPFSTSREDRDHKTTIAFEIENNSKLTSANLSVFNIKGQKLKDLFTNKSLKSGYHSFGWNGQDELGRKQSSGVYFYQLSDAKKTLFTGKMIILN